VAAIRSHERIRLQSVWRGTGARGTGVRITDGFEPFDAGPLRIARNLEPFALLMGQLAHGGDDGPELA
jgi:predicted dinucleotide-binding enzyme